MNQSPRTLGVRLKHTLCHFKNGSQGIFSSLRNPPSFTQKQCVHYSRTGFLILGMISVSDLRILCCRKYPVHCMIFNSIPGLLWHCPPTLLSQSKMSTSPVSLGLRLLVENHYSREIIPPIWASVSTHLNLKAGSMVPGRPRVSKPKNWKCELQARCMSFQTDEMWTWFPILDLLTNFSFSPHSRPTPSQLLWQNKDRNLRRMSA